MAAAGLVGLGNGILTALGTEADAIGAIAPLCPRTGAKRGGTTLGPRMELTEETTNATGLVVLEAREAVEVAVEDIVAECTGCA